MGNVFFNRCNKENHFVLFCISHQISVSAFLPLTIEHLCNKSEVLIQCLSLGYWQKKNTEKEASLLDYAKT